MKIERYKEFYEHEWQRRENLQSAVNTPISIITLLGGAMVLMGKGFDMRVAWRICSGCSGYRLPLR
jgi:hypothetical protein